MVEITIKKSKEDVKLSNIETVTSDRICITHEGVELTGIYKAEFIAEPNKIMTCKLEIALANVSVSAQPDFQITHPLTGNLKSISKIIFEDGEIFDCDDFKVDK